MRRYVSGSVFLALLFASWPHHADARLLCIGDSITRPVSGQQANNGVGFKWCQLLHDEHAAGLLPEVGDSVVYGAQNGLSTADVLAMWPELVEAKLPATIAAILLGSNDHICNDTGCPRVSLIDYAANLREIIARLRTAGAVRIILISPPWVTREDDGTRGAPRSQARLRRYVDAMRRVAVTEGAAFVDVNEATGRLVGWSRALWESETYTLDLGVHPTPLTHRTIADYVRAAILAPEEP